MAITTEMQNAIKKITYAWTSDGSGDATATTSTEFTGSVLECITIPGSGGNQPTDQYDVTVTDADGVDVLHGNGANRSNASNEYITEANSGTVVNDKLAFAIANAGDTKSGTVILYLKG